MGVFSDWVRKLLEWLGPSHNATATTDFTRMSHAAMLLQRVMIGGTKAKDKTLYCT